MNVNIIAGFTDRPDNVQGVEAAEEAGERAWGEDRGSWKSSYKVVDKIQFKYLVKIVNVSI